MTCPHCKEQVDARGHHHKDGRISSCPKGLCRKGHPLSGDNLLVDSRGSRRCRQCGIDNAKAWRRRGTVVAHRVCDDSYDPRRVRAALAAYPDGDPSDCQIQQAWEAWV